VKVKLVAKTVICDEEVKAALNGFDDSEKLVMYCARVSNPNSQNSGKPGLLRYCLDHGHVSIFEMANMVFEIETSRAIAAQILRHRSFSFQEFSQRYAEAQSIEVYEARSQDLKNRQNSNDDMTEEEKAWFAHAQKQHNDNCIALYKQALARGVAKEQARFLLPLSTTTKLYMNGSIRSWIHYLQLRCGNGTQLEHQQIALAIRELFVKELPIIGEALGWKTKDTTTL
jgi:thymidylate synthase (FAD)